jgi:PadR family transcriptional regulator PadR
MRGEALKGHLDGLLLATVRSVPRHGYAIVEELRRASSGFFDLPEGTIYPALHRLEQAGLLDSRWETENGRRRRVYVITRRGRSSLVGQQREWSKFAHAVNAVLEGKLCPNPI